MKRCFKWLINWFTKLGKEERREVVIDGIIGIISIIIAISIFVAIDKVPATPSDYEPMEKQAMAIQKDPDLPMPCTVFPDFQCIQTVLQNAASSGWNRSL